MLLLRGERARCKGVAPHVSNGRALRRGHTKPARAKERLELFCVLCHEQGKPRGPHPGRGAHTYRGLDS